VFACRRSLQERLATVRNKGKSPASSDAPSYIQLTLDDQSASDDAVNDATPSTEGLEGFVFEDGESEEALLQQLLQLAEPIEEQQESKVQALLHLLSRILGQPGEKVVIFTEFRDTLDMLERVLTAHGYGSMLVTYHGATPPAERDQHRRAFLANPNVRIFLATDAASEGINLHKSCNTLIHVEIPWNPNRYEQRNGRIDRYGQESKPQIFILLTPRSVEQRIAEVVIQKLERIRTELGSVANVFPMTQKLKLEQFLRDLDTSAIDQQEQLLSDDASLNPAIEEVTAQVEQRLDQLQQEQTNIPQELMQGERFGHQEKLALQAQLNASRAFVPEYQDVEEFLRIFMTLADMNDGQLRPTRERGVWSVDIPDRLRRELGDVYRQRVERYPRATFQRQLAIQEAEHEVEQRVEFLSPGHPLVQSALRFMRGCAFKADFPSRIAYRRTAAGSTPGYLFTYATRFVDGRGETLEERFEVVFVALDGTVSQDAEADVQLFTERRPFGNLSAQEESEVLPLFQAAFEAAKNHGFAEAQRRRDQRCRELQRQQERIIYDALELLGRWREANEIQLRRRFKDLLPVGNTPVQLPLVIPPDMRRRKTLLRKEQEKLESQRQERRRDIEAMKEVRGESIDAIGALVLIPEAYQPSIP
jgi:hypothetical protein